MHILKIFCIVFILFFPGKQRCWRWRLLLNIKCQLFSTAAAGLQCSVSSAPLPPFLASSAQCSLVQLSSSQSALHWPVHSRRNYTIFGQSKVDTTVQCSALYVLQLQPVAGVRGGPWNKCFSFRKGSIHIWRQMIFGYFWHTYLP